MDPSQTALVEIAKGFGVAAPLVCCLFYLLWRSEKKEEAASAERRENSERHSATLTTVITESRISTERLTSSVEDLTRVVIEDLTTAREARAQDREEHRNILSGIGKANIKPRA